MQKNYQKYNKMYNTEIYFHKDQELGIFLTKITNGEQQDWSLRKITTTISQYVHKQKLIDPSCPEMIQADSQLMKALGQQTFHTKDLVNLITSQINKVWIKAHTLTTRKDNSMELSVLTNSEKKTISWKVCGIGWKRAKVNYCIPCEAKVKLGKPKVKHMVNQKSSASSLY